MDNSNNIRPLVQLFSQCCNGIEIKLRNLLLARLECVVMRTGLIICVKFLTIPFSAILLNKRVELFNSNGTNCVPFHALNQVILNYLF